MLPLSPPSIMSHGWHMAAQFSSLPSTQLPAHHSSPVSMLAISESGIGSQHVSSSSSLSLPHRVGLLSQPYVPALHTTFSPLAQVIVFSVPTIVGSSSSLLHAAISMSALNSIVHESVAHPAGF